MEIIKILGENAEIVNIYYPIILAAIIFLVKKVPTYLKKKVVIYKYFNLETTWWLIEYELLGTIIGQIIVIISVAAMGNMSTWEVVVLKEYIVGLVFVMIVYIIGIIAIVNKTRDNQKCSCIKNAILGSLVYVGVSMQMVVEAFFDIKKIQIDVMIYVIITVIFFVQAEKNIERKKIKNLRYILYADTRYYKTKYKPIREGDYTYIKIFDKEGKFRKMIQIPNEKIVRIEHIIDELENEN